MVVEDIVIIFLVLYDLPKVVGSLQCIAVDGESFSCSSYNNTTNCWSKKRMRSQVDFKDVVSINSGVSSFLFVVDSCVMIQRSQVHILNDEMPKIHGERMELILETICEDNAAPSFVLEFNHFNSSNYPHLEFAFTLALILKDTIAE